MQTTWLLCPLANGLNKLLNVCSKYVVNHGITYNVSKPEVMIFKYSKGKELLFIILRDKEHESER